MLRISKSLKNPLLQRHCGIGSNPGSTDLEFFSITCTLRDALFGPRGIHSLINPSNSIDK